MSSPAGARAQLPNEGQILAGKYRLGRQIGAGSAGTVFEAENLAIRRRVAVKVLDESLARMPESVARFEREAQAAGRLGHAHIVEVLDLGATSDGVPFIVMEYLEGATLRDVLEREGRLEVPRAIDIALSVLDVLAAAHAQGIVHRDLKPENIFLTERGRRADFVKVLDFGVAKFNEPGKGNLTDQGMTVGTPNYMSPEQVRGRDLDARSDVYSMAVVIWEMIAGGSPHEGANSNEWMISIVTKDPPLLSAVRPDVDPRLSAVLAQAMRRAVPERTASARELAAALEPFGAATEIDVGREVVSLPAGAVPSVHDTVTEAPPVDSRDTSPDPIIPVTGQRQIPTEYIPARPAGQAALRHRVRWIAFTIASAALMGGIGGLVWSGRTTPAPPIPRATPLVRDLPPLPRPHAPVPPAPPPAVAPARVPVVVDANVTGAFVTLDGNPLGTTPLRTDVASSPGEHDLEVSADDRVPERRRIRLDGPVHEMIELRTLAPPDSPRPRRPPAKRAVPPAKEGTFDPFRRR